MTKRKRRYHRQPRTKPIVEKLPLGTIIPDIQHETIEGDVVHDVTETLDGQSTSRRRAVRKVIREPMVQPDAWDDPSDQNTRSATARQVHGHRRSDPLVTLHRRNPHEITRQHLRVCERYRDDFEIANGARGGRDMSGIRGSGAPGGPTDMQMQALQSYQRANEAVGARLSRVLAVVVLGGSDLQTYAESAGCSAHVAKGYLTAALDRLSDHYEPVELGLVRSHSTESA